VLLQVVTDLPAGFSTLLMETEAVHISDGGMSPVMRPADSYPDAANQLCRLLSCAPASYRRAYSGTSPSLSACVLIVFGRQAGLPVQYSIKVGFLVLLTCLRCFKLMTASELCALGACAGNSGSGRRFVRPRVCSTSTSCT